jgi:hypothetical protein
VKQLTSKFAILAVYFLVGSQAQAIDTSVAEKNCADIGFKRKTEAFGNCVLELMNRGGGVAQQSADPDDATCKKYGYKQGTRDYGECRLKLDLAKQQAAQQQAEFNEKKRQYDEQVAALEKEKKRRQALQNAEMFARYGSGQTPNQAIAGTLSGTPFAPPSYSSPTQTIIMPGGKMINCTTTNNVTACF